LLLLILLLLRYIIILGSTNSKNYGQVWICEFEKIGDKFLIINLINRDGKKVVKEIYTRYGWGDRERNTRMSTLGGCSVTFEFCLDQNNQGRWHRHLVGEILLHGKIYQLITKKNHQGGWNIHCGEGGGRAGNSSRIFMLEVELVGDCGRSDGGIN